ncbi:SAV_2336 N-terminal domain-related protein [Streptomyces sp. NPDC058691]|uniref:SAV_2336 N-terminal domain-related protein n=1 Tax=Streptomyces sp. NPDC058691 TaxID=3346601 RepID=UPI003669C687
MPTGIGEAGRRPLTDLVGRLRAAGVDLDAEGIADALWLAQWVDPGDGTAGAEAAPAGGATADAPDQANLRPDSDTTGTGPEIGTGTGRTPPADPERAHQGRRTVDLLPVRSGGPAGGRGPLSEIAVPTASAFPALLPLQRALRPMQQYRPPVAPARTELDEDATAERTAGSGLVWPVLRGVRRHEADLQLLMDGSASMAVWEQMLQELREVGERVGAFRNVTVRYLRPYATGVGAATAPGPDEPLSPAEQLYDPTGRRLSLVVSDCAGPLWQDGRMHRLLRRWAEHAPVAVLQPLPQRLWPRTFLPAVPGVLRRRPGPYRALEFRPQRRRSAAQAPPGALPVPVLSAVPAALGSWARLVSGTAGVTLRGAAAWVAADAGPDLPVVPDLRDRDPGELLHAFETSASPQARQLAVHLSAAPLALPVMQLVQRAMLPQTGPTELAEVLLSGLVVPVGPQEPAGPAGDAGESPWYDFLPGVRDLLLRRLTAGEAALVLKHCSLYIEKAFGRSARNFPAVAVAYLSGAGREPETGPDAVPEPFARVSERVLRRFEPSLDFSVTPTWQDPPQNGPAGPAALGIARLERYERGGSVRDLLEAVRLLRAAAGPSASGTIGSRLADALRHAWREWGDSDVLGEAEQAARAGLTAGGGPYARLALARVLAERADAGIAAGRADAALPGLREAAGHCRAALAGEAGAGPSLLLSCALQLAECLRTQYALEPPGPARHALLQEAEDVCNAQLRRWRSAELPSALLLGRGRVLLDRARTTGEQSFAVRAAADLRAAVGLMRADQVPAAELRRPLLDLAEALTLEPGGRGVDEAHDLLTEAAAIARELGDGPAEAECLRRVAETCRARWERTGDAAHLRAADTALTRAQRLVPHDAPVHVELLVARGEVALKRAELDPRNTRVVTEAVHVLREAVAETASHAPRAAARRLLFGQALRLRHERQGGLADLHEAAWVLELATRAEDAETAARAWLELGDVQDLLARRTGAVAPLTRAAEAYAEAARRTAGPLLAARAHHRRAVVLERTAGAAVALSVYLKAADAWEAAGAADSDEAHRTADRIRALRPRH